MNDYTDIIDLNRPLSKHANLGVESRAAQFAPFAALTGYDAEIRETARLTDKKIEVDDGLKDLLNSKLAYLNENIKERNEITITFFVKDKTKEGGSYETVNGIIKKIDPIEGIIKLENKDIILMQDVLSITGDIFKNMYESYE